MPSEAEIYWIDPIALDFASALTDEDRLLKLLRKQLRAAITGQGFEARDLKRCVYVVRMTGPVVVAYPTKSSPVLYVGRGDAPGRLATHLGNWLSEVHRFGRDVGVELRICVPRRRGREGFFKCVEADLIRELQYRYGAIPFFNSRRELRWEHQVTYFPTSRKQMSQALGVGSGKRPQWAIRPTRANANYVLFNRGHA